MEASEATLEEDKPSENGGRKKRNLWFVCCSNMHELNVGSQVFGGMEPVTAGTQWQVLSHQRHFLKGNCGPFTYSSL